MRDQKLIDDSPLPIAASRRDGIAQRHAASSVDHNLAIGYFGICLLSPTSSCTPRRANRDSLRSSVASATSGISPFQ
jgi:hypothetical protein